MGARVLRGLIVGSGALIMAATVVAIATRNRRADFKKRFACKCESGETEPAPPVHRQRGDYFQITRSRGKGSKQKWVLQGFGRYQCFLLFDSWREAMDQATFHAENLATKPQSLRFRFLAHCV
jgi:hypothetical protein